MRAVSCLLLLLTVLSCAEPKTQSGTPAKAMLKVSSAEEVPLVTGGIHVPPFDDARADPTFAAYRDRLQQIVRSRDAAALETMLDPKIRVSFGESNGLAAFRRQWKPASPDSRIWAELDRILSMGGAFQPTPNGQRFIAPYVFSNWPESMDAFEYVAAICRQAIVRANPSPDASALGRLEWQALRIGPEDPMRNAGRGAAWRQVILPDGRVGWLEASCARSPMDYRAAFEKSDAGWRMVYLIAGD